jgi:hypothetical protein
VPPHFSNHSYDELVLSIKCRIAHLSGVPVRCQTLLLSAPEREGGGTPLELDNWRTLYEAKACQAQADWVPGIVPGKACQERADPGPLSLQLVVQLPDSETAINFNFDLEGMCQVLVSS